MDTYYADYIPNFSIFADPLNELHRNGVPFVVNRRRNVACNRLKQGLASGRLLVHFDTALPVGLASDASSYGVGAELFVVKDGVELPVRYASRSLTAVE